jgi:hypothetical protein
MNCINLGQQLADELELIIQPSGLLMARGSSVCLECESMVTPMTQEAVRPNAVQDFHCSPLGLAKVAEVFLFLVRWHRRALNFLIDGVNSPLDSIDGMSVVDIVPCAIAGTRVTLAQFRPGVSALVNQREQMTK